MVKELSNICSKFYRHILIAFNIIILIVGILVTTFAAVVKYDKDFSQLIDAKALTDVINITQINSIAILFLAIGVFAILLSFLGILGLCCLNRCLLVLYEIIVILLFLTHAIGLLVLVFGQGSIEKAFRGEMENIVMRLKNEKNDTKYEIDCQTMQLLSDLFKCCGNSSSTDFINNPNIINNCCKVSNTTKSPGCTQLAIDSIETNAINYLLIPSGAILGVELLVIILNPLIISDIRKQQQKYL